MVSPNESISLYCAMNDAIPSVLVRADDVSAGEFRAARGEFEAKMRHYAPRALGFLGKRALAAMCNRSDIGWGRYEPGFAGTTAWVLPNPSGRNRRFPIAALVEAYAELRAFSR